MRPHPHLYEIPTWAWLADLARDNGVPGATGSPGLRLVDVPDGVWDVFEARGFDLIWLMGLWRRSPESRRIAADVPSLREAYDRALPGWQPADVVGSPYAVRAYEPDPALASWDELDAVRAKLHRRGLQLVLDFVPNHTARDHPWVGEHPEYYVRASSETAAAHPGMFFEAATRDGERVWLAHGRDPYWPGWTDTAQLNYSSGAMRAALIDELRTIAAHADGVRCDVAMLVLNDVFAGTWRDFLRDTALPAEEFWAGAATAVPDLLLVAEVYWGLEARLQELGFHFTYDKALYDHLRDNRITDVVEDLEAGEAYQRRLVRFLENHDEPRSLALFGRPRLEGLALLHATLPGMRFYHHGQLEGRTKHLTIQLARAAPEPVDRGVLSMYDRLLAIASEPLFHEGEWRSVPVEGMGANQVVAYRWRLSDRAAVVVINLSDRVALVRVGPEGLPSAWLIDRLTRQPFTASVDTGLELVMAPYAAHLFAPAQA